VQLRAADMSLSRGWGKAGMDKVRPIFPNSTGSTCLTFHTITKLEKKGAISSSGKHPQVLLSEIRHIRMSVRRDNAP